MRSIQSIFTPHINNTTKHPITMMNRAKTHHDVTWSGRRDTDSIPWHQEESLPVRRGRLTTLHALELIRLRYEAGKRQADPRADTPHYLPEHAEHNNHEQQAA